MAAGFLRWRWRLKFPNYFGNKRISMKNFFATNSKFGSSGMAVFSIPSVTIALEECGHTPRPLEWHFPVEEREVPETILLDPASNGSGVKVLDEAEVAASPAADWVRLLLGSGVRWIKFDGEKLRQPSPPADKDKDLLPDGSNLPWVILRMHKKDQEACIDWRLCAMSSFRRLRHIEALERESDGHAYLQLHYERGLVVPSWIASESMLRIIALAAVPFLVSAEPACILTSPRIYLFENPENGINRAEIEQIYKHLRWSYNAHVLIESNEIQMLYNVDDLQEIVGFCKNEKGIADVLTGDRHPHLQRWRGVVTALDKLFGQDSTG